MPHVHDAHCGHENDDSHLVAGEGTQDLLFSKIDIENVQFLNAVENKATNVFKPWDERLDESKFVESDADEQLIIQVPFTGNVKLRSIIVKSGPSGNTANKLKIFSNRTLDFNEADSSVGTQEIDIPISREAVEYPLRVAKFPVVKNLSLFFPSNHGEDSTRVYYIGFKGEFSEFKEQPMITVYELKANPADHTKVQGTDGVGSRLGGT
ncbi:DUF1000-domain-containing protein [Atractiella rhizophila]|nr:DUF1000-domain-containing protein [Atractiella rhizophila]